MNESKKSEWFNDRVYAKITHLDSRMSKKPIVCNFNGARFQIKDGSEVYIPRAVANHLATISDVSLVDGTKIEKPRFGIFFIDKKVEKKIEKGEKLLEKPIA